MWWSCWNHLPNPVARIQMCLICWRKLTLASDGSKTRGAPNYTSKPCADRKSSSYHKVFADLETSPCRKAARAQNRLFVRGYFIFRALENLPKNPPVHLLRLLD